jgi:glycosyltransferase involved in cell wall biosynthesis
VKTIVIIPVRNEAASIGLVIDEIPRELVSEIVVVDNGSTDDTGRVAALHGARVVREEEKGYGAACLKGLASVSPGGGAGTSSSGAPGTVPPPGGAEIVVILDGDHSDYPGDLPLIIGPILEGRSDLVIGSRVLGNPEKGSLQWNQRFGNALACSLIRRLYGFRFTDMGPFRAIRRTTLEALGMRDRNFGWNAEMQVKAIAQGFRIVEVPVRYRPRIGRSKISGTVRGTLLAGSKIIWTILRHYPAYAGSRRRKESPGCQM